MKLHNTTFLALIFSMWILSCNSGPPSCDWEYELAFNEERRELGIPILDSTYIPQPAEGNRQCYFKNPNPDSTKSHHTDKHIFYNAKRRKGAEVDYYELFKPGDNTFTRFKVAFSLRDAENNIYPWEFKYRGDRYIEVKPEEATELLSNAGFHELVASIEKYSSYKKKVPEHLRMFEE